MGLNADGTWDGTGTDPNATDTPDPATTNTQTTPNIQLSDQSGLLQGARDDLSSITADATSKIEGAQAGDVSYEGVESEGLLAGAGVKGGSTYLPAEALVSNQLNTLMDADSDYQRIQERKAKEQAADIGLLGSSAAVGATRRAAIESALPIAQQDAETFAKAALQEQNTYNEISRMKAESDLSGAARDHVYDIDVNKGKLNATITQIAEAAKLEGNVAAEMALTEVKNQWDAEVKSSLAELEASLQERLQSQEISAREKEWASSNSSQVMAAAYGSVNDLLANAEFMASYDGKEKEMVQVFNNFINFAKDQVGFIGSSAGMADDYMNKDTGWVNMIGSWGVRG